MGFGVKWLTTRRIRERYGPAGDARRLRRCGEAGTLLGLKNTAGTESRPSTHT